MIGSSEAFERAPSVRGNCHCRCRVPKISACLEPGWAPKERRLSYYPIDLLIFSKQTGYTKGSYNIITNR